METQGQKANYSGKEFEKRLEIFLNNHGFKSVSEREYINKNEDEEKCLICNAHYYKLMKMFNFDSSKKDRTEFLLKNGTRKIRIEVKCQNKNGSVFDKWASHFESCTEAGWHNGTYFGYPENEIIFVYTGKINEENAPYLKFKAQKATEISGKKSICVIRK